MDEAERAFEIAAEQGDTMPLHGLFGERTPIIQTINVHGDNVVASGRISGGILRGRAARHYRREGKPTLAERRQDFLFDFLKHSLKQSEMTFRVSIAFMACGAAVVLAGAIMAVVRAGGANHGYVSLVTSLTGALITVGGGALALHARRARSHATEQADRVERKIDEDDRLEKAKLLIERVEDPVLRDRLKATAALQKLGFTPDANETANRLMPLQGKPSGEIGPAHDDPET
ncbi:TRADD-N-associated membrane domain-containing protein [Streptomyces celluloflavus]|uniref:TRADD-N-associated membrane domain-containing protein n=1 Tax=Streptomyces celluloflavus TaxID=58344 RepID=UPI00367C14DA